jgi:glyoxylase-like metal-dependent hydrolase (beta-lactamase superfamily II)
MNVERRRVGGTEIIAMLDADFPDEPMSDSFPGITETELASAGRYPALETEDGRWRLRVRAWLVRHRDGDLLLDTGIGGATSPTQAWAPQVGAVRSTLEELGVPLNDIQTVVVSHVHDDHIGGLLADDGSPLCPNARYVIQRADVEWLRRAADTNEELAPVWALLGPLHASALVDAIGGDHRLRDDLSLRHAPGHTPGHQVLVVEDGDARMLLSGDTWNHPLQLASPERPSAPDEDPSGAAATRRTLVDDVLAHPGTTVAPTHFAEAFGELRTSGDDVIWVPVSTTGAPIV